MLLTKQTSYTNDKLGRGKVLFVCLSVDSSRPHTASHYTYNTHSNVTEWLHAGFGLVIGFIQHLQHATTNNEDILNELHAPNITVTTEHIKPPHSWLVVTW
jgi:hypothetical protein